MLDYLDEIESDLSVFHQVRDLEELDAPRFYRWATQLPHYDGALRGRLRMEMARDKAAPQPAAAASPAPADVHPEVLAAMSDHPGFPGIEYAGG